MGPTRLDAILGVLTAHRVEFIVVGGVAGVLQGAPLTTIDLDVVHSRRHENVARLQSALADLDARFREKPDLRPALSHLESAGHLLLMTTHGPLDLLGSIGKARSYEDLIACCDEMTVGQARFKVLGLGKLIETKAEAGREKDLLMLPILRRTLEEKRRPGSR